MAIPMEQRRQQQQLTEEADRLYEQYGKPLEEDHFGEFVAITRDGRTMLGADNHDLTRAAKESFGPGNFIFKVGPRVVGKLR
ncbi:MAG: hypothetical protein WKH64_18180 [Chloroflexia bacterium]